MKNIIVTGGCGFIGSNFINYMTKKYTQYNFINLDNLYYCANENNIIKRENYEFIKCNISVMDMVRFIFKKYKPEIIFHFAAQSHVDGSFENPLQYLEDNTKGTVVLLEAIRLEKLKIPFFHISTDEVYGESQENKKKEHSILLPTNPYAASKAAAEMFLFSYMKSFDQKYYIIRGNNVYGINQYEEKLIPKFIKLLKENKKCTIHGNGKNLRSFIHISDFIKAVETVWEKGTYGEIYNIASDEEISVIDVAKILIKRIKNSNDYNNYIKYVEDRKFNDSRYLISPEKLINLGWTKEKTFNDAIKELTGKKILVYGSNGWIGNLFCDEIQKKDILFRGKSRCDNLVDLEKEINNIKPDIIISCIGRTYGGNYNNIDFLEDQPEINQRDNFDAPKNIFDICEKNKIFCLYIGTGCIFEYDNDHPINGKGFTEEDKPNFFGSAYSRKKGELDILSKNYNFIMNCRIRMPITKKPNSRNFIDKIKKYSKICSIPNSMTYLDEAVPEMLRLIKLNKVGTINVVNPGTITHAEILDSLSVKYTLIDQDELEKKIVKGRRSNNYLITSECLNLTPIKKLLEERSFL